MKRLILFVFLLAASSVQAVTLTHLYSVNMPIHSQVTWRRLNIMPKAMAKVLIKVSGNPAVMQNSALQKKVKAAQRYVSQYSYFQKQPKHQLMIHLAFDPAVVKQWLTQAGEPVWGATRPLVLLWLVERHEGGSWQPLTNGGDNALSALLKAGAQARGLPLVTPLMDLADMQTLSTADVLQGNWVAIQAASARYSPDAILLVSVDEAQPKQVTSQWHLLIQGNEQRWSMAGAGLATTINQGMNQLTALLVKQYAVSATTAGGARLIQLKMINISRISDYAKVRRYLSHVVGVKRVTLSSLDGSSATFNLQFSGNVATFVQQLKLGHELLPVTQNNGMLLPERSLVYQLSSER
jgi:uncharacterized protein